MTPHIVTIRPGVAFAPAPAASWQRMEKVVGRLIDVNSSYRDYDDQLTKYNAYRAYANGTGPWAPFALHPDRSMHCKGLAVDTDDQQLLKSLRGHGWRQTALDKGEPWHFDYFAALDTHTNDPADSGSRPFPTPPPSPTQEDDMNNSGIMWKDAAGLQRYAIVNTTSGLFTEWNGTDGNYNDAMRKTFRVDSYAAVTLSHANAIKASCGEVRK